MSDSQISPSVRAAAIALCVSPKAILAYLDAMRSWDRTDKIQKSHEDYPIRSEEERRHS